MSFYSLLRVPLIFIVHELFKSSFELPDSAHIMFPVNSTLNQIEIGQSVQYSKAIIKIIVSCLSKFNKFWIKNNITTFSVNLIFYSSSVLFIIIFIHSTWKVFTSSVPLCCFYLYCTCFLLGKHAKTRIFIRKIQKL